MKLPENQQDNQYSSLEFLHKVPVVRLANNPMTSEFIRIRHCSWIEIKPNGSAERLTNGMEQYIESIYQKLAK